MVVFTCRDGELDHEEDSGDLKENPVSLQETIERERENLGLEQVQEICNRSKTCWTRSEQSRNLGLEMLWTKPRTCWTRTRRSMDWTQNIRDQVQNHPGPGPDNSWNQSKWFLD